MSSIDRKLKRRKANVTETRGRQLLAGAAENWTKVEKMLERRR